MGRGWSEVQLLRYLLLSILALLLALPANAAELLILQSHSNPIFDQTVRQIQNGCGTKSQTYVMGNYAEFDLGRVVREEQPRVIIAVGDRPLKEALKLRSIPVIYTLALSADEKKLRNNVTGVSIHTSAEKYLKLFRKLGLRRAGVVYSRAKSGAYIDRAKSISSSHGVELITAEVNSPNETEAALTALSRKGVDSIWMIPDTTAVTAETLNSFFLHAQRSNTPLISFSRGYLAKGAIAVLESSRKNMTDEVCSNLSQILSGTSPSEIPVADISEASLYTNPNVANKLGISLSGLDNLFNPGR